jgi:glycosyltransferase involved in cell wall biosynthesis
MTYDRDITVVIATIGEESLLQTVVSILNGSVVPYKILLCIPDEFQDRVYCLARDYACVEVMKTAQKGQVIQRILGFQKSTSKYTLQLDSDVIVDKFMVENLKKFLKSNPRTCVGPVIFRSKDQKPYSFLSSDCNVYNRRQKKVITWILNGSEGYQSGTITRGGVGFGPDIKAIETDVQWLPGCCIMHETDNLITNDFYPWEGKAYGEDLFHSYHISKNGINLSFDKNSKLNVDFPESGLRDLVALFKGHCIAFKVGLGFVRLTQKSVFRFSVYTILNMLFLLKNKIFH